MAAQKPSSVTIRSDGGECVLETAQVVFEIMEPGDTGCPEEGTVVVRTRKKVDSG